MPFGSGGRVAEWLVAPSPWRSCGPSSPSPTSPSRWFGRLIRADWHQHAVATADNAAIDPFDAASLSVVATTDFSPGGLPITIDSSTAELSDRLDALLAWEGRLDARGITCPIKDLPDVSCGACPISKADDTDDPLHPLCRVGISQESVATTLIAKRIAVQGVVV